MGEHQPAPVMARSFGRGPWVVALTGSCGSSLFPESEGRIGGRPGALELVERGLQTGCCRCGFTLQITHAQR